MTLCQPFSSKLFVGLCVGVVMANRGRRAEVPQHLQNLARALTEKKPPQRSPSQSSFGAGSQRAAEPTKQKDPSLLKIYKEPS